MDFLSNFGREFAHKSRQSAEEAPDGLHTRTHDGVLQIGGEPRKALQRRLDRVVRVLAREFEELVAG